MKDKQSVISGTFRGPLITPFCFPTWAFSQLLRYQNTHITMLNSVFGALYLKKIPALVFQKELVEVPLCKTKSTHLFLKKNKLSI
jgi:hypothetical protein